MHEKAAARKTVMEFDDESGAMSLKDDAMVRCLLSPTRTYSPQGH